MDKKLIDIALSNLPNELLQDSLFIALKDKFFNVPFDARLIGPIDANEKIYSNIVEVNSNYQEKVFPALYDEMLRIIFYAKKGFLLEVLQSDEGYEVHFKITEFNRVYDVVLFKFDGIRCVRVAIEERNNNICEDYNCNIYYYDENDNLLELDREDIEKEIDEVFSERFLVPLPRARITRTNFKQNKDFINMWYAKQRMAKDDSILNESDLLSFAEPMEIDYFKEEIINRMKRTVYRILKKSGLDEFKDLAYDADFKIRNEHVLDSISLNLNEQIGSGKVVFSRNLIDNLFSLFNGISLGYACTNGVIVKKLDESYIIYYAHLENDSVILMPKEITKEEAQELFYKGRDNEENQLLKEFFEVSRAR